MYYYLLTIQYDGTDFCGWAKQKGQSTIQGEIESAINRVARNSTFRLVGASKTDAGVHANDQKAWLELNFQPNSLGFLTALNNALPRGIKIISMVAIDQSFRVRNCVQKTYHYNINLKTQDVFLNRYYFQPKRPLDLKKLKTALELFVGEHDFTNFSGLKDFELTSINPVRAINSITLTEVEGVLKIEFKAKGFIRYQIRMIVGAALAYATNKVDLTKIKAALLRTGSKLPFMAKPEGLTLFAIEY